MNEPRTKKRARPQTRPAISDPETIRLNEDSRRQADWKRWGPYLSERQWGTVREDYSRHGECWDYLSHDQARSRAYRWGEDGLLGICDRQCRLCFSVALWNERDPILKERLFGLTNGQGNHGEDVKECYHYLDSTPTHSYMKGLYKYPIDEFPYDRLELENRHRGLHVPEFEIEDTGIFDEGRYHDVTVEYAKAGPQDILIRITIENRSRQSARLHILPTLWFRNTWAWGRDGGAEDRPVLFQEGAGRVISDHRQLGRFVWHIDASPDGDVPEVLFTGNETNVPRLFGVPGSAPYTKDAFHDVVIHGRREAVNPSSSGTKAAAWFVVEVPAEGKRILRLRLTDERELPVDVFGESFEMTFRQRIAEADEFYSKKITPAASSEERMIARQACAGLLWSKQFYHYVVGHWLDGDPAQPQPEREKEKSRNRDWPHLYNRDIISMPDKWEYPWYAAWDLAFHMIPMARIDADFAKSQLLLLLREWYMHPNGQIPAYEFNFSDVNPPVHAWAVWRVYKMTGKRGERDKDFLKRAFHKLMINFTWWINRKDVNGQHLFAGGFLGLDNIGVFDRSQPLPTGGQLEQSDGTAWMAFYCVTMLAIALELAMEDKSYEDVASKFFEHFVAIADATNNLGGSGLWQEDDGFYYDHLRVGQQKIPLRIRSMVGLLPLCAVLVLEEDVIEKLPAFARRMKWFVENRSDLAHSISYFETILDDNRHAHHLLAIPTRERLQRVLQRLVDENEFLSPHGVRSLSQVHSRNPYVFQVDHQEFRVDYVPGESTNRAFGGNSNWRGPIWFPVNYLLIEALEQYDHFFGDSMTVECPAGSGQVMTLGSVANELRRRLASIFFADIKGHRPCHGSSQLYQGRKECRDLLLFHEYFHGENGRGLGASHQTGWTALVAPMINDLAASRDRFIS
jgi:Glycosyl hydrolase family 63 C-terminal domain